MQLRALILSLLLLLLLGFQKDAAAAQEEQELLEPFGATAVPPELTEEEGLEENVPLPKLVLTAFEEGAGAGEELAAEEPAAADVQQPAAAAAAATEQPVEQQQLEPREEKEVPPMQQSDQQEASPVFDENAVRRTPEPPAAEPQPTREQEWQKVEPGDVGMGEEQQQQQAAPAEEVQQQVVPAGPEEKPEKLEQPQKKPEKEELEEQRVDMKTPEEVGVSTEEQRVVVVPAEDKQPQDVKTPVEEPLKEKASKGEPKLQKKTEEKEERETVQTVCSNSNICLQFSGVCAAASPGFLVSPGVCIFVLHFCFVCFLFVPLHFSAQKGMGSEAFFPGGILRCSASSSHLRSLSSSSFNLSQYCSRAYLRMFACTFWWLFLRAFANCKHLYSCISIHREGTFAREAAQSLQFDAALWFCAAGNSRSV